MPIDSEGRNAAAAPLPAAPAADRAELAAEAKRAVDDYVDAWLSTKAAKGKSLGIAKARVASAIDALARSTDAPSEPVSWGYANTVGNAIAQLKTMDAALPIFGALHLDDGRCIARGLTFSRERVVGGRWIGNGDDSVPYSIVAWTQDRNALATPPVPATSTPCASGEADTEDMAAVGRALMETIATNAESLKGWHPNNCPSEIVVDLINERDEALAATQAPAVPATEPLKHSTKDTGDCPSWCRACAVEAAERARTPTASNTEDARSMGAAVPATDAPAEQTVDVHTILRQADEQQQARAEQLPTEQDCIRLMVQCRLRLEELDWRSIDYAPKQEGKPIDAIVPGWPNVKECHWLGSSWFAAECGDFWPVKPAWFKARAALTQAASTRGKS